MNDSEISHLEWVSRIPRSFKQAVTPLGKAIAKSLIEYLLDHASTSSTIRP